jgi:hypothetical protein
VCQRVAKRKYRSPWGESASPIWPIFGESYFREFLFCSTLAITPRNTHRIREAFYKGLKTFCVSVSRNDPQKKSP